MLVRIFCVPDLQCPRHPPDQRDRFSSGTSAVFLVTTFEQRWHANTSPQQQPADTAGTVKLVSTEGQRCGIQFLKVDRDSSHRLNGVQQQRNVMVQTQF